MASSSQSERETRASVLWSTCARRKRMTWGEVSIFIKCTSLSHQIVRDILPYLFIQRHFIAGKQYDQIWTWCGVFALCNLARCCQWRWRCFIFVVWNNSVITFKWSYIMIFWRPGAVDLICLCHKHHRSRLCKNYQGNHSICQHCCLKKDNEPKMKKILWKRFEWNPIFIYYDFIVTIITVGY